MKNFKAIIAVVAFALMGLFVFQNMDVVEVNFLIWSIQASRVIIYLSIFLVGVLIGWLSKSLRWL